MLPHFLQESFGQRLRAVPAASACSGAAQTALRRKIAPSKLLAARVDASFVNAQQLPATSSDAPTASPSGLREPWPAKLSSQEGSSRPQVNISWADASRQPPGTPSTPTSRLFVDAPGAGHQQAPNLAGSAGKQPWAAALNGPGAVHQQTRIQTESTGKQGWANYAQHATPQPASRLRQPRHTLDPRTPQSVDSMHQPGSRPGAGAASAPNNPNSAQQSAWPRRRSPSPQVSASATRVLSLEQLLTHSSRGSRQQGSPAVGSEACKAAALERRLVVDSTETPMSEAPAKLGRRRKGKRVVPSPVMPAVAASAASGLSIPAESTPASRQEQGAHTIAPFLLPLHLPSCLLQVAYMATSCMTSLQARATPDKPAGTGASGCSVCNIPDMHSDVTTRQT